jgi:ribosome-associated heat shock protein Hsp15
MEKLRLDKWLWAARFFKTRSLAKSAIERGKVLCGGQHCKSSREISVGMIVTIERAFHEQTIEVLALSYQRRGAPEAALLYRESTDSQQARLEAAASRKKLKDNFLVSEKRPNKKDRRLIKDFKNDMY